MNRWARDLRLPATWRSDGIYPCRAAAKKLYITHRPVNKEFEVSPALLGNVKDTRGMYLGKNYSERRAQLVDVNCAFRIMVVVACPGMAEIATTTSSKDLPREGDEGDEGESDPPPVESTRRRPDSRWPAAPGGCWPGSPAPAGLDLSRRPAMSGAQGGEGAFCARGASADASGLHSRAFHTGWK